MLCSQLKINLIFAISGQTHQTQSLLLHGQRIVWSTFTTMHATNIKFPETARKSYHAMFHQIAQPYQQQKNASKSIHQKIIQNHCSEWQVSSASSENHYTHLFLGVKDAKFIKLMMFAILMRFQEEETSSTHVSLLWEPVIALLK